MIRFDQLEYASLTDVGMRRSHNQDSHACLLANEQELWEKVGHLFVVADGMGAHAVGEKASELAANIVPHIYQKHAPKGAVPALKKALLEANATINNCGQQNREFEGMGTTGTALALRADGAWIAHVGDSRVYRIRDGWIEQLTYDHSLVWEYARIKQIDPSEVRDIPPNVIHRCLGPEANIEVDLEGPYPLVQDDIFLICSDGLSGPLSDEEIAAVAMAVPAEEACRLLIDLANLRGGPDNITVVIARVQAGPESNGEAPPAYTPPKPPSWLQLYWWFPTLFLGAVVAGLAAYLAALQLTGGVPLLFVASLILIAGLVGLYQQHRREQERAELEDDVTQPRIHRRTPANLEPGLVERLAKAIVVLRQRTEEREWEADWETHQEHFAKAEQHSEEGDIEGTFREYCLSMLPLTRAFDKNRHKEEVFKPLWDKT